MRTGGGGVIADHIAGSFDLVVFKVIWGTFVTIASKWPVTCFWYRDM